MQIAQLFSSYLRFFCCGRVRKCRTFSFKKFQVFKNIQSDESFPKFTIAQIEEDINRFFKEKKVLKNAKLYDNEIRQLHHEKPHATFFYYKREEKESAPKVLMNYEKMVNTFGKHQPNVEALREFVSNHFEDAKELELWRPPDWKPNPHIMNRISDDNLRKWAADINTHWTYLGRKMGSHVIQQPDLYSIISVPHGFLISCEKLKELYYWDSYWIVKGLLMCNMWDTAKDIIKNFLYLVEKYNYIPSGTRIYFYERSQPPLLTIMMESYYNHTKDLDFLKNNINILEKEMDYWRKHRSIVVRKNGFEYHMFQYNVKTDGPRPEAYRADERSGMLSESDEELENHFTAIKSAAESGWCLSTRWYVHRGYNHGTEASLKEAIIALDASARKMELIINTRKKKYMAVGKDRRIPHLQIGDYTFEAVYTVMRNISKGNSSNTNTQAIVPVDLNAIMHRNFVLLSKWYQTIGDKVGAKNYQWQAENLLKSIEVVLWNEDIGMWLDYDVSNNVQRNYFYMSNFVPLWTKSYRQDTKRLTEQVINYLYSYKVDRFQGGVPASLEDSGELWDFPNCWPPLQAFLVQGLDRLGNKTASRLAFHFADKFIKNCYKDYKLCGTTRKFYNCLGSRYNIDISSDQGYGWSNGVIFEFLDRWGGQLTVPKYDVEKLFIINKDQISLKE